MQKTESMLDKVDLHQMHRILTEAIWGRRSRMVPSGFHHLNKAKEGRSNLHYFLLGDDAFALIPWLVKPFSRRQLTREKTIAKFRISRGRKVVDYAFGILVSRFRVLLGTMEQKPKAARDFVFTCVVLHNMLRILGGAHRAPTSAR